MAGAEKAALPRRQATYGWSLCRIGSTPTQKDTDCGGSAFPLPSSSDPLLSKHHIVETTAPPLALQLAHARPNLRVAAELVDIGLSRPQGILLKYRHGMKAQVNMVERGMDSVCHAIFFSWHPLSFISTPIHPTGTTLLPALSISFYCG